MDESKRLLERLEQQQHQAFNQSGGGGFPPSAAAAAAAASAGHLPGESGTIPLSTPFTSVVSSTAAHLTSSTSHTSTLPHSLSSTHTKSHAGTSYGTQTRPTGASGTGYGTHLKPADSRTSYGTTTTTTTTRHHFSGTSYGNRTPAAGGVGSETLHSARSPGTSPVLSRGRGVPGHMTPTGSVTLTSYGVQTGATSPSTTPRGVATVGVVTRGAGGATVNGYRERVGLGGGATGVGGGVSPGKSKVDLSSLYEQRKFAL